MNISAVTDLRQVTTCERLTYYRNCYVTVFLLFICSDKSMPKPNRTKGAALWSGIFFNIADYENSTLAQNYRLNSLNQVISQYVQNKLSNGDFVCPWEGDESVTWGYPRLFRKGENTLAQSVYARISPSGL